MTRKIIDEIGKERIAQDTQWGGPAHDDAHLVANFFDFIATQLEKATDGLLSPQTGLYQDTEDCRQRFVKIAALAVAALESMDRRKLAPSTH